MTEITKEGSTLGTLPYMSPEQVQGRREDHRSDLFSHGIMLCEIFSGLNPFKKNLAFDTAHAITQETPRPASDEVFRTYRSQFAYDKKPLNAKTEKIEDSGQWTGEKTSFDAAYDNERMLGRLFLPKTSHPPPGSDLLPRASRNLQLKQ